jgi:hypothetical protein
MSYLLDKKYQRNVNKQKIYGGLKMSENLAL